ncbi:uncharacterized protein LOC125046937 [Penaeus chinensis]|uniref:uncharacterized protein LOC125046937 n=1 Tax=Penaeus chinensis TaxID=139456 RepID=UPI001FB71D6F|nr:uncharacterized protein LOC125046937 [Penaeus chinensis]
MLTVMRPAWSSDDGLQELTTLHCYRYCRRLSKPRAEEYCPRVSASHKRAATSFLILLILLERKFSDSFETILRLKFETVSGRKQTGSMKVKGPLLKRRGRDIAFR